MSSHRIEWTGALSVGVPSIDAQHRQLVDLLNDLDAAVAHGYTDEITRSMLDRLIRYANEHFGYEEELFARTGYPDAVAHVTEHALFRQHVEELDKRARRGEFVLGIEVVRFLREWLLDHVQVTDRAYGVHLRAAGID